MASMDDLIATMSSGLRAGQHGNDIQDLHAKLASTINQPPSYNFHPIPSSANIPATHSSGAPLPPPAPVSSWNSPPPTSGFLNSGSPSFSHALNSRLNGAGGHGGIGTSPRQGSFKKEMGFMVSPSHNPHQQQHQQQQQQQQQQNIHTQRGFGTFGQASGHGHPVQIGQNGQVNQPNINDNQLYPNHSTVLPLRASPKDTGGFEDDAFAPLWRESDQSRVQGQQQGGRAPIRQEQGGWSGRTRSGAAFGQQR